jgi:hypothetical protein
MWYEKNWFYYEHNESEQLDALLKTINSRWLDNIQDMLYRFLWDIENWDFEDMKEFVKNYKYYLSNNQL